MPRKALVVAAVVGTILTVINQGDLLFPEQITKTGLRKILLIYLVPFCVSVYSVLAMSRERAMKGMSDAANTRREEKEEAY